MIDNELLFWDGVSAPQTGAAADSEKLDLGPVRPGPGERIEGWLVASPAFVLPNILTLVIRHSYDLVDWVIVQRVLMRPEDPSPLGDGKSMWTWALPSNVRRYVDIYFEIPPAAGIFSAGINMDQQTNP